MTTCQWFALCDHDAIGVVRHPVLGAIPTCQRCVDKLDLVIEFDHNNPNPDLLPDPADGWHDDHRNLVILTSWLADHGHDGSAVAHAVEKPWNYQDEYKLAMYDMETCHD